jgi:hypothetical protein
MEPLLGTAPDGRPALLVDLARGEWALFEEHERPMLAHRLTGGGPSRRLWSGLFLLGLSLPWPSVLAVLALPPLLLWRSALLLPRETAHRPRLRAGVHFVAPRPKAWLFLAVLGPLLVFLLGGLLAAGEPLLGDLPWLTTLLIPFVFAFGLLRRRWERRVAALAEQARVSLLVPAA